MVTVKFIVLSVFVVSCACYSKYCKICPNHVMCLYSTPGPGIYCKEYDKNKFLTNDDIYDLVNQINERRNFIALGRSRHLPSAANMKKLVWSEELATFAQKWVDQCDPSLQPDKEDQCRNLENTNVGQNIASIINPSSRFNVKSFIEMWFMQLLDYKGSVTYYDRLQDYTSKFFTQLIWAETENVGCGRAKFKVHNVTVDRLVCNFSPKGNIHGKPIYSIGYPRTQCQSEVTALEKFQGLCAQPFRNKGKLPAANLPVSSLLKILNLSNDSVKQEIDPIYNNMKQIIPVRNEMDRPKHPIMRHIFGNKLQSKKPNYPHLQGHEFWGSPLNISSNFKQKFFDRNKGYPRREHSHIYKYTEQPSKRNDYRKHALNSDYYDNENTNKFKKICTRSTANYDRSCEHNSKSSKQNNHQCTRGLDASLQLLKNTRIPKTNAIPNDMCPCSTDTVFPSTNTQRMYTLNCECVNDNGLTIRCPSLLRTLEDNVRDRDTAFESEISLRDSYLNPEDEYEWLFNKRRKNTPQNKRSGYILSNRNRCKRDFGDSSSFKPFWQIDGFSHDGNPKLKALRYTTLPNKRQRKNKNPHPRRYSSKPLTTESITIKFKNTVIKPVTEKYLSFDELLHLRKLNLSNNNAKRRMEPEILRVPSEDKAATVESQSTTSDATTEEFTTNYTANTPFVRMKHCTRKRTCTWTAASLTDSNGSVVGNNDRGSRTPPGYVEGCTRTSTCTRDYMNRNKFPTTIVSSTDYIEEEDFNNNNDTDYCERRSLNLRKRNSHTKELSQLGQTEANEGVIHLSYHDDGNFRNKRSFTEHKCTQNDLSYGDLYYLVLSKIVKKWNGNGTHNKTCPCNKTSERHSYMPIILLFFVLLI